MNEPISQFEGRKCEHIQLALKNENEAVGQSGFDQIKLVHEALPEHDFSEMTLATCILGISCKTPFLVSSMTAGHDGSVDLNMRLAKICAERGWLMGVGSQRRELYDFESGRREWSKVRKQAPQVQLLGNIGLAQLILAKNDQIQSLVDSLEAVAMIVHLNPLQECLQGEGTPQFKGGLQRLTEIVKVLNVPVVVKETGCGFSANTLRRLIETGVAAVDVSGYGGTHWGRIEGQRQNNSHKKSLQAEASATFANWGISTVQSLLNARTVLRERTVISDTNRNNNNAGKKIYEIWASGGVRSGLDAARALALGASCVGLAKPILQAALESEASLLKKMELIEFELKMALFCTGGVTVGDFTTKVDVDFIQT